MATSQFAAPLGATGRFYAYDAAGNPLSGGKVNTFVAGTATPQASYPTYTDALAGTNANANPVILDSAGSAAIWLQALFYKITVTDSNSVTQFTADNVAPAFGSPQPAVVEWAQETSAATFLSSTSFVFNGVDRSGVYHAQRRIRTINTGGTIYSTVVSVSFAAGNTTVTVLNDSGNLDSGLSAVAYGFSYVNPSYLTPRTTLYVTKSGNQGAASFAASTKITTWTSTIDSLVEWNAGNNRWIAKYPGNYLVTAQAAVSDSATATAQQVVQLAKNGVLFAAAQMNQATVNIPVTPTVSAIVNMVATDFIEVFVQSVSGTSSTVAANVTAVPATTLSIVRIP